MTTVARIFGVSKNTNEIFSRSGVLPAQFADADVNRDDVVNIATNQLPNMRNDIAEQKAQVLFNEIYTRNADMSNSDDYFSVMTIAYGLRPKRYIKKEEQGLPEFIEIYDRVPSSTLDWNILRDIVY